MTNAQQTAGRFAPSRASLLVALLAATAALTGAQALAPAPAAAMVSMGEECDPLTTIDCEPANGGGGGGAGGTTGGGGGGGEIIGEAIYVEGDAPPSPCRPSTCLPSQIGGSGGFLDRGGKDPRGPHPRGRATRVGEVAKPKAKAPTKAECERLKSGQLVLPAEAKSRELSAQGLRLWKEAAILRDRRNVVNGEYWLKVAELQRVAGTANGDSDSKLRREGTISNEIAALKQKVESLDREEMVVVERYLAVASQRNSADDLASAEKKGQLKKCAALYGGR